MNRFRMNIEVKGCSKAYDEDEWFLVEIGGVSFMVYDVDEVCVLRTFGHLYSCVIGHGNTQTHLFSPFHSCSAAR